ncbi:MAG: hypothetical protein HRT64_01185 [Erythrobacter sp.]|nr:hypothetical protein [Erythrobacter sp.]
MSEQNKAIRIEDDHARAGQTPGVVRRVLAFSLGITVLAMSAVWIIPALWG